MRLGDEARGLSILSTYSCYTHSGSAATNDRNPEGGAYVGRWQNAFGGGLRIATGTTVDAAFGSAFRDVGKRYSDNLQAGKTIASAWLNALKVGNENDPSVIVSGRTEDNCFFRLDSMTWNNFASFERLFNGEGAWLCRRFWMDV
jgi:hypothetical protein